MAEHKERLLQLIELPERVRTAAETYESAMRGEKKHAVVIARSVHLFSTASWALAGIPSVAGCCGSLIAQALMLVVGHFSPVMSLVVHFGIWAMVAALLSPLVIVSAARLFATVQRDRTDEEEAIVADMDMRRIAEIVRNTMALNHRIEGSNIRVEGLEDGLFAWSEPAAGRLAALREAVESAKNALRGANLMLRIAEHDQSTAAPTDLEDIQRSLDDSGGRIRAYLALDEEVGTELLKQ